MTGGVLWIAPGDSIMWGVAMIAWRDMDVGPPVDCVPSDSACLIVSVSGRSTGPDRIITIITPRGVVGTCQIRRGDGDDLMLLRLGR
jgi:hypothetical protein